MSVLTSCIMEKRGLRAQRPRPKLDFPFATINVILLLLFFSLLTGSIIGRNETVLAPPVTTDLPLQRLPRPLLLVAADGSLLLDETPVDLEKVAETMRGIARGEKPSVLSIMADRAFPAAPFLTVVQHLRGQGIPVRIVTLSSRAQE